MDEMTGLRQAVDQLLAGRVEPLLGMLAEDVEFKVAEAGDVPERWTGSGAQEVADYFSELGGLTAFWQIDYGAADGQVIAWGKESFTVQGTGLEGECEFALVFEVADGLIERLVVIEDLPSFVRHGGRLTSPVAA